MGAHFGSMLRTSVDRAGIGGKDRSSSKVDAWKTDRIYHDDRGLFRGLSNPFVATRYHSLVIHPDSVPAELEVSAWVEDEHGGRQIMGVRHRDLPLEGWQFHPESFLTEPAPNFFEDSCTGRGIRSWGVPVEVATDGHFSKLSRLGRRSSLHVVTPSSSAHHSIETEETASA